jgi:hypothetical protein
MGKDNIRKGFGDFWRLKRGLTPCAILNGGVFDRENCVGPLLEKREKWRTPSYFSASDSRPDVGHPPELM